MSQDDTTLNLVATIYQAAMQPAQWENVLKELAVVFHGHMAFTMNVGAGAHDAPGHFIFDVPPEALALYGEHYYRHDLWSPVWLSRGLHTSGKAYTSDQMVSREVFRRSVWYNEFLRVYDIEHSVFTPLVNGTSAPCILGIDRPVGSEPFSETDCERLEPYIRHLSQAMGIWLEFQVLNEGILAHEEALHAMHRGIISINFNGRMLYANEVALNVLANKKGLTVKNGFLCGLTVTGQSALTQMLALAKKGVGRTHILERQPPHPPLRIQSVPLGETQLLSETKAGKVLLIINEVGAMPADAYEHFAKLHKLTRQETKVLAEIVEGYVIKEIAERHGVSVNTVRSQVKSLMEKTDSRRQKDLIRLFFAG